MAVNKVVVNGSTLIDLTGDTVTAETLVKGTTAHNKAGAQINGTYEPPAPSYDTPGITVSTGGLITASANGKTNTQQLTTQSAKTVTPSESQQTAVASGRYTTGAVLVAAIPSTYIGSAVSINYYHIADTEPSVSSIPDGDFVFIRG